MDETRVLGCKTAIKINFTLGEIVVLDINIIVKFKFSM